MDDLHDRSREQTEAVADRGNLGRFIAVGSVVLWLVTLVLVAGPAMH